MAAAEAARRASEEAERNFMRVMLSPELAAMKAEAERRHRAGELTEAMRPNRERGFSPRSTRSTLCGDYDDFDRSGPWRSQAAWPKALCPDA